MDESRKKASEANLKGAQADAKHKEDGLVETIE